MSGGSGSNGASRVQITGPPAASASSAVVGHQKDRQAAASGVVEDEPPHPRAQRPVQSGERLVQQLAPRGPAISVRPIKGAARVRCPPDRVSGARPSNPARSASARAVGDPPRPLRAAAHGRRQRAKARFSPTVRCGNSRSSWNRIPTPRRSGGRPSSDRPSTDTEAFRGEGRLQRAADQRQQARLAGPARPHDRTTSPGGTWTRQRPEQPPAGERQGDAGQARAPHRSRHAASRPASAAAGPAGKGEGRRRRAASGSRACTSAQTPTTRRSARGASPTASVVRVGRRPAPANSVGWVLCDADRETDRPTAVRRSGGPGAAALTPQEHAAPDLSRRTRRPRAWWSELPTGSADWQGA